MFTEITLIYTVLFFIGGSLLGMVLGGILGWFACDKWADYVTLKNAQIASHPEMYDQEGNLIKTDLTAVRVVLEENDYYLEDDD
tara:strand:- start:1142 stop:1393 length:252 start_codon:yes stop_codon:yes gene_type:complete